MKLFKNLKLRYKVLLMAILPVFAMCVAALVINETVIKDTLLQERKMELRATAEAVVAAYNQNSGDYFVNANGDVWKGAYNISLSETFIDEIAAKTGVRAIIGFDAHKRQHLCEWARYEAAKQYLEGLGLPLVQRLF